jgi:hypothetical protein
MSHRLVVQVAALIVLTASAASAQMVPTRFPRAAFPPPPPPMAPSANCPPGVECVAPPPPAKEERAPLETRWIGQGGLRLQSNANPVVHVEVANFRIWATPTRWFPIVVAAGLPVSRASTGDDVIASVLAQDGGVLNVRVGAESIKILKGFWEESDVYGAHADFFAGGKLADAAGADEAARGDPNYIGLAEARANLRLVLPLTESARQTFDPMNVSGTLHLRVQSTYSRTTDETYRTLFGGATLLDESLWSSSLGATLVVTDVIYLETGWVFHTSDRFLNERDGKRFNFSMRMLR